MDHTRYNCIKKFSISVSAMATALISFLMISGQTFAADRLELDETSIVGSKELPKVLYIVPWQDTREGDMTRASLHGSSQKGMAAIDREVFQRELQYFEMLQGPGNVSQK